MAVLIEAISVVVRAEALLNAFDNDWNAFKSTVPNRTLCADNELVSVAFMSPVDVEAYVEFLAKYGLTYIRDGKAMDVVVVDQQRGPMIACDWIEYGHVNLGNDPVKRVAACRLKGSQLKQVLMPDGWTFEHSLSASFGFAPTEHVDKSLTLLRHESGLDVYYNRMTGEEVFIGRTGKTPDRR